VRGLLCRGCNWKVVVEDAAALGISEYLEHDTTSPLALGAQWIPAPRAASASTSTECILASGEASAAPRNCQVGGRRNRTHARSNHRTASSTDGALSCESPLAADSSPRAPRPSVARKKYLVHLDVRNLDVMGNKPSP
jgi:hypothetical protein